VRLVLVNLALRMKDAVNDKRVLDDAVEQLRSESES
jgi:hypothetical protein